VEFRGYASSQTPVDLLGARLNGPEVLNEKNLSIPVDLLRARRKHLK
jgi:hypothetical protein